MTKLEGKNASKPVARMTGDALIADTVLWLAPGCFCLWWLLCPSRENSSRAIALPAHRSASLELSRVPFLMGFLTGEVGMKTSQAEEGWRRVQGVDCRVRGHSCSLVLHWQHSPGLWGHRSASLGLRSALEKGDDPSASHPHGVV